MKITEWRIFKKIGAWRIFKPLKRFIAKRKDRKNTVELEAEVYRCETILKTLHTLDAGEKKKNSGLGEKLGLLPEISPLLGDEEKVEPDSSENTVSLPEKITTSDTRMLLNEIKKGKSLSQYLKKTDNDPILALAHARGEIAYQSKLRSSGLKQTFVDKAALPIVLILITAAAGNLVGWVLQESAFYRNKGFEEKLERLQRGETAANNMIVSFRLIAPYIARDESREELKWDVQLSSYGGELEKIQNYSTGVDPGKIIDNKIQKTNKILNAFVNCLNDRSEKSAICSKTYSDDLSTSLKELQDSISETLINFLEK